MACAQSAVAFGLIFILLLVHPAEAQTEWFDVIKYRSPGQCERMMCLSVRLENCRDHLHGFYLKEKGCDDNKICTNCAHGNSTIPGICYCENPPYTIPVSYGQQCGMGKVCTEGECYRPCYTFLHSTSCPKSWCLWKTDTKTCINKPPDPTPVEWLAAQDGIPRPAWREAQDIVESTETGEFPIGYQAFRSSAEGFRVDGILLNNLTDVATLFESLDGNSDGYLSPSEYAGLVEAMRKLEAYAPIIMAAKEAKLVTEMTSSYAGRRLQEGEEENLTIAITPEICNSMRPRQFFCSFDQSCKLDCRECGWKSATDTAFSLCVRPTSDTCWADGGKVFCESDQLCHAPGDCSNCVDRPIVDHSQHQCLQLWWNPEPLTQMRDWVCRFRNKNGMTCTNDQDCIYGMRRCIYGACMPFQPYNPNQTCVSDLDCPHLNHYCPSDPTGGENEFWIQYCREQGGEGFGPCTADRECMPDMRCNIGEPQPVCRRLFSRPIGAPAHIDELCSYGWRDANFKCAPPAKSKQLGYSCDSHADCTTTDSTGRTGECICKAWWEMGDSMYCNPVAGDYRSHQVALRNYLFFRARNCGVFWTEEECLRIHGDRALLLKLELDCETQQLVGGPFKPDPKCGVEDEERFPDACARLEVSRNTTAVMEGSG